MVYKHPGPYQLQKGFYDYTVVDIEDVPKMLKEGWYKTSTEALENSSAEKELPKESEKGLSEKEQQKFKADKEKFEAEVLDFEVEKEEFEKEKVTLEKGKEALKKDKEAFIKQGKK